MKKKIFGGIAILAIAAIAAFNVNLNMNQKNKLSLLALVNVEALAEGEASSKKYKCYSILDGSGQSVSCSTCQMANGKPPWYHFGDHCTRP